MFNQGNYIELHKLGQHRAVCQRHRGVAVTQRQWNWMTPALLSGRVFSVCLLGVLLHILCRKPFHQKWQQAFWKSYWYSSSVLWSMLQTGDDSCLTVSRGRAGGLTPALTYSSKIALLISQQEMNQEGELSHNPKPSQQPKQLFIICGMAHGTHSSQTNRRARSLPWRTYNLWSWPYEMLGALLGRVKQFHLRIILAHLGRSHLSC